MTRLGVILRESRSTGEDDPGHMVIFWEEANEKTFRGYRFNLMHLPDEHHEAVNWRSFLFEHTLPGYIVDDIRMYDEVASRRSELIRIEEPVAAEIASEVLDGIARRTAPRQQGKYSFNPDNFDDCNNCVTWAVQEANVYLDQPLKRPRQGRIKLMVRILKERSY